MRPHQGLSARWTGEIVPIEQGDYRFRVTTDSGRQGSWELFVDNEKVTSEDELLELKAERAVDLELRWMDSADIKVHYITVTAHPLTNYVLTDGINSVEAKTSDQSDLNELVNALKKADGYGSLLFTIQSNTSNGTIELNYKNELAEQHIASITADNESPIEATSEQNSGDHSVRLEWAKANKPFEVIDVSTLRTGKTITAMDILGSNDLLIPILDRELYTGITKNWEGNTKWGDIDNDGDLDLLVFSFDEMGNGESQILINEVDDNGHHHFTSSFDLPAFERVHSAEWGDWNSDGYLDLVVTGIRTNEEFKREETVELLLNREGIDFHVATPEKWEEAIDETWITLDSDPTNNILKASWGDLDLDGQLDLAITNEIDTQILIIPSNSSVFKENLPHGMNGTKLQFGHYESSDGDASFADRGLGIDPDNPFPETPERIAEGMDIAAHRSWSEQDYSTVSSEQELIFWDSYSNLFDLNRDLVSLDPHLAQLNEMMNGDINANYLTKNGLIELAPSSTELDLSYSFYRINRNLLISAPDSYLHIEEVKPSTKYVLTDGSHSIEATTSDETDLKRLVDALKQADEYGKLQFTIQSNTSNGRIELNHKNESFSVNSASITAGSESPTEASSGEKGIIETNNLSQAQRAELAKYWYVNPNQTSNQFIQSAYLDAGSSSAMDESLVALESKWEFMGGGNYNDNPLTFRYDQDYFYFLEFDDSLAGNIEANNNVVEMKQHYTANDILGRNSGTGEQQNISNLKAGDLNKDQEISKNLRELLELLLRESIDFEGPHNGQQAWSTHFWRAEAPINADEVEKHEYAMNQYMSKLKTAFNT